MRIQWPFVLRSRYEKLQLEKFTLLDDLRNANAELRRHRQLIADLTNQNPKTVRAFEKIIASKGK